MSAAAATRASDQHPLEPNSQHIMASLLSGQADFSELGPPTALSPTKRRKHSESWHPGLGVQGLDLHTALTASTSAIPVKAYEEKQGVGDVVAAVALRFAVGDEVETKVDGSWLRGTVVAHSPVCSSSHLEEAWRCSDCSLPPPLDQEGSTAPYQVMLIDEGSLIWAPSDSDRVIRARSVHPELVPPTGTGAADSDGSPKLQPWDARERRAQKIKIEDAVSGQLDVFDPQRSLDASDFYHVLTDVTDTVMRVMGEEGRTELGNEDRAFITRRVQEMVHAAQSHYWTQAIPTRVSPLRVTL